MIKILVGNKCDQVGKREVSEVDAEMFAKNKGLEYIEVSALNASNVTLVFETIGKHILQKKKGANKGEGDKNKQPESKLTLQDSIQNSKNALQNKCC